MIAHSIFKAYDIRGIVGEQLNEQSAELIGRALGSEATARGLSRLCVGRDGRLSGAALAQALARGILSTGVDVIDVGQVTTPMLYFAAQKLAQHSGVMVTGSHNPPNYNGFKMLLGGETLFGELIQDLKQRIENQDFVQASGGQMQHANMQNDYESTILQDVKLSRRMKIAVDCGNGVAGAFAADFFRRLGCEVIELFSEVDGRFPNHHPDPSRPENLRDLIDVLQNSDAEIGLAFDGDGDRLGVVTKDGSMIFPDRQLLLFAQHVLQHNPGASIIFDVKSTQNLVPWIKKHGGKPILCRTGHSFIKAEMKKTGALLAGEMSGHIFFKDRYFGFDDGMYAGARLLEILSQSADASAVLHALPDAMSTPELQIPIDDPHAFIERLQREASFPESCQISRIDGLRVEYAGGFGLIRASNTTPILVLRFEAQTPELLAHIQADFRRIIHAQRPDLSLPF